MVAKSTKKHTVRRGGVLTPAQGVKFGDKDIAYMAQGPKYDFPPVPPRKKKGGSTKRKIRGGYYGATGAIAPGAMEWGRSSEMGDFAVNSTRAGNNAVLGAGRKRRGSKKASRKTRRRLRKMRGGEKYGVVSAGFLGDGTAGMANVHGVTTNHNLNNSAKLGAFNDGGAHSLKDNGNFITTK
jgi:hypothetical protein